MKINKAISHELHVWLASNPAVISVLGHNPGRHNPDRTQPGQTQPGQTQPKQGHNLDRTHPGQDITWTGRNLDRHSPDMDKTRTGTQPGQETTQTQTDSVFTSPWFCVPPYIQIWVSRKIGFCLTPYVHLVYAW